MSPEDDVRAASIAAAARSLLRVLASEGIDIEETRLLQKALDEAWGPVVARLTPETMEKIAQYQNRPGMICEVSNGVVYYGSSE